MALTPNEQKLYQLVGGRVRAKRTAKYTQAQIADLLQVSRTSITNLEKGNQKFPLHILYRLSLHLNCSMTDLLPSAEELREDHGIPLRGVQSPSGKVTERTAELIKRLTTETTTTR
jgi:transcriptional regulator with XRE-family HTH domain